MGLDITLEANKKLDMIRDIVKRHKVRFDECWETPSGHIFCLVDIRDTKGGGIKVDAYEVNEKYREDFLKGVKFKAEKSGEIYISPQGKITLKGCVPIPEE